MPGGPEGVLASGRALLGSSLSDGEVAALPLASPQLGPRRCGADPPGLCCRAGEHLAPPPRKEWAVGSQPGRLSPLRLVERGCHP